MKQTNLSIFIPHSGCPHTCSFCNQRYISGAQKAPTANEVREILAAQQPNLEKTEKRAEIAFFGGSFTAIERDYMISLLETAQEFCRKYPDQYCGIRCSTRPDCIDADILALLKKYGMTAIELGAQSMSDDVLAANERGHNAEQVRKASRLIKSRGFELGLQMMTGLYLDTREKCLETANEFISLNPDTVRIYPTVILENTRLAELMKSGGYAAFSFEETVDLCAELLEKFNAAGISVIRLGLHASAEVEKEMIGGNYHPALREICENRIFLKKIAAEMTKQGGRKFIIYTDGRNVSKINGQKGSNRIALEKMGFSYKIKAEQGTYLRITKTEERNVF